MRFLFCLAALTSIPNLVVAQAEVWSAPRQSLSGCGSSSIPWLEETIGGCLGPRPSPVRVAIQVRRGPSRPRVTIEQNPAINSPARACISNFLRREITEPTCEGSLELDFLSTQRDPGSTEVAVANDPGEEGCRGWSRRDETVIRGVIENQASACFAAVAPMVASTSHYWIYGSDGRLNMALGQGDEPPPFSVQQCLRLLDIPFSPPSSCRFGIGIRHRAPGDTNDLDRLVALYGSDASNDPRAGWEPGSTEDAVPPARPSPIGSVTISTDSEG